MVAGSKVEAMVSSLSIRTRALPSGDAAATWASSATALARSGLRPPAPSPTITRSPENCLLTESSIDCLSYAPTTANSDTTATPISIAVAVAAVRRGLRIALR